MLSVREELGMTEEEWRDFYLAEAIKKNPTNIAIGYINFKKKSDARIARIVKKLK